MAGKKLLAKKQRQAERRRKKQPQQSEEAKGALYCRTSSKANEHGASMPRQQAAGKSEAIMQKIPLVRTVCEVISGSLPMDQRKQFKNLLAEAPNAGIKKIFVESARALSRDADVGEEIYKKSKEQGEKSR